MVFYIVVAYPLPAQICCWFMRFFCWFAMIRVSGKKIRQCSYNFLTIIFDFVLGN